MVENTDRELLQIARPKRTIQRKPSGIHQAVIWVNGTRHAKSLETRDERGATNYRSYWFLDAFTIALT
jgi:hypothetical protein